MDYTEASSLKNNSEEINKTYIISTLTSRCVEASGTGRLTLQRRNPNSKNAVGGDQEPSENAENRSHWKRLTLQRRTRTGAGSTEKSSHPHTSTKTEKQAWTSSKILSEPNSRTGSAPLRSVSLKERGPKDMIKPVNTPEKVQSTGRGQRIFSTPTGQTRFQRVSLKKEVFERLSAKDQPKSSTAEQTGVERQKHLSAESNGGTIPGLANKKFLIISQNQSVTSTMRKTTTQPSTGANSKSKPLPRETLVSAESGSQTGNLSSKELKMENSAVTVAVRVRPFSHR